MASTLTLNRRLFMKAALLLLSLDDFVQNRHPLVIPNQFPEPKFWFGQRVRVTWYCSEDGQYKWEESYIVGLWFNSPDVIRWNGWGYAIQPVVDYKGFCCQQPYVVGEYELEAL